MTLNRLKHDAETIGLTAALIGLIVAGPLLTAVSYVVEVLFDGD